MKFVKSILISLVSLFIFSCNSGVEKVSVSIADTTQIKALLDSGTIYLLKEGELKKDLDSAQYYFISAEKLSIEQHQRIWKNKARSLLAECSYEYGNSKLGKDYFLMVIKDYQDAKEADLEGLTWLRYAAANHAYFNNPVEHVKILRKAMSLFKANGNIKEAADVLKEIAETHYQMRNIPLAEKELLTVLSMYNSIGYKNLHYTYDLLSGISVINGRYNKALYYAQEMIKSMNKTNDTIGAGNFYLTLADVNFRLGNFNESIRWWLKCYDHYYLGQHIIRYDIVRAIVFAMTGGGQSKRALNLINKVTSTYPPTSVHDKRNIFLALAISYQGLNRMQTAERFFIKAVAVDNGLVTKDALSSTINYYTGRFYVINGRYQKAAEYLKTVKSLTKQYLNIARVMDTEYLLFKIDSAKSRLYSAINHFQIYSSLRDSIFNETKSKQIEELQVQYQTDKREHNIQLLKNRTELQQINLNITYAGILSLLILLAILYKFYLSKNKRNQALQAKQVLINQKNDSLQQLVNEKEWLLKEVHHRVKNNLQIVQSLLNSQSAYLQDNGALLAIQNSKNRVQAISLIHQKLYQSENMDRISMNVYIRELCQHLRESFETNKNISFELSIDDTELDVSRAVPVGLIINEAITNSIKYAFGDLQKGKIEIILSQEFSNRIILTVRDNGSGLPNDFDERVSGAFGIKLINGLSEDLDGQLSITQHHGTEITLTFLASSAVFDNSNLSGEKHSKTNLS
jgi:two-component sensor histidine kinase